MQIKTSWLCPSTQVREESAGHMIEDEDEDDDEDEIDSNTYGRLPESGTELIRHPSRSTSQAPSPNFSRFLGSSD